MTNTDITTASKQQFSLLPHTSKRTVPAINLQPLMAILKRSEGNIFFIQAMQLLKILLRTKCLTKRRRRHFQMINSLVADEAILFETRQYCTQVQRCAEAHYNKINTLELLCTTISCLNNRAFVCIVKGTKHPTTFTKKRISFLRFPALHRLIVQLCQIAVLRNGNWLNFTTTIES